MTYSDGFLICGSAAVGAAVAVCLIRWTDRTKIDWHITAEIVGHFATAFGVAIAGIWALYVANRHRSLEARAEVIHRHQIWQDPTGRVLRVVVVLRNPGQARLKPGDGITYVQTLPRRPIDSKNVTYLTWIGLEKIHHPATYEEVWIDPKESERYVYDVSLPPGIRYIQLYTLFNCKRANQGSITSGAKPPQDEFKPDEKDDHWSLTTLIDLEERPKAGGHDRLLSHSLSASGAASSSEPPPLPPAAAVP